MNQPNGAVSPFETLITRTKGLLPLSVIVDVLRETGNDVQAAEPLLKKHARREVQELEAVINVNKAQIERLHKAFGIGPRGGTWGR